MSDEIPYTIPDAVLLVDGAEYPMPGMLSGREAQTYLRITGSKWPPATLGDFGLLGNFALAIIALRRAGIFVDEDSFLDKRGDAIQSRAVDVDPPAEAAGA